MKIVLCCMVLVFCACSSVKVLNAGPAAGADLTRYRSFDFYNVSASGDTVAAVFNERVGILKEAIAAELMRHGYVSSTGKPDLLVNIGIMVDEKIQTRTTDWRTDGAPRYVGQRNYSWKSEEIEVGRYREGTITVHLVDALQNQLVWRGAIQGIVPDKTANAQKNATEGMLRLFKTLPSHTTK